MLFRKSCTSHCEQIAFDNDLVTMPTEKVTGLSNTAPQHLFNHCVFADFLSRLYWHAFSCDANSLKFVCFFLLSLWPMNMHKIYKMNQMSQRDNERCPLNIRNSNEIQFLFVVVYWLKKQSTQFYLNQNYRQK